MYLVKYSSTLPSSTKYSQVQVLDQTVKYQVQPSTHKIVLDTRYSSTSTVLEPNPDTYINKSGLYSKVSIPLASEP